MKVKVPADTPPTHTLDFNEEIKCIEFCSNDFAYNLICIAFNGHLALGLISFPEEADNFEWETLKNLSIEEECRVLCFSPDTSLIAIPKNVTICAAINEHLNVFRTDLHLSDTVQELKGHRDYVNDVAWVCDGEFLASVSDDQSCRIWNVGSNYDSFSTFCLSSAGMSVKWHSEDPNKILVAEKSGKVHLYNVRLQQVIVSVESPKAPLSSADWANNNRLYISVLAAGDIITWDLSRPFVPADIKQVHEDGGRALRFSPSSSELVVASVGRPHITLKIFTAKSTVPLIEAPLRTHGGMCWHHRLPYVAAASDRKLHFWKVLMK